MKRNSVFVVFLLFLYFTVQAFSNENWSPVLNMKKKTYLPGEPVWVDVQVTNSSREPLFHEWGSFYLDDAVRACMDRNFPPVDPSPPPPPGVTGEILPLPKDPPETIHSMELEITRWCNLDISSPNVFGLHSICYGKPRSEGGVCVQFEIAAPSGLDQQVFEKFPKNLRNVITDAKQSLKEEIMNEFGTSSYAAYLLWERGHGPYDSMSEIEAQKEFDHDKITRKGKEGCPGCYASARKNITNVIDRWEPLYRNFPDFVFRERLLYGLSRAYFRLGEPEKSAPLLKELLQKHPKSNEAKKAEGHIQILKSHSIWKD